MIRSRNVGILGRALLVILLAPPAMAGEVREEEVPFAGTRVRVVRLQPSSVQLVWKDDGGMPYRTFANVQNALAAKGKTVRFLMNAGIFEPGGIPSGLHIEGSKEFQPVNRRDAPGNFFLKPNGMVSFQPGPGASVRTVTEWDRPSEIAGRGHHPVLWAVQSGPILLSNGKRHPAFKEGSANKLHRNGVGVNSRGELVFAITFPREMINLWDFAGLFLHLDCRNALFLDGDISQMAVNPAKPVDSNPFGAIFVVAD